MGKERFKEGRIGDFLQVIATLFPEGDPKRDPVYLKVVLQQYFPEISDNEKCPNCSASMREYMFHFDVFTAILLIEMGSVVRTNLNNGYDLTQANMVHVPSLMTMHTVQCRTTQASKLGLVSRAKQDGKYISGTWVITKRGFKALAGEPVPKRVRVWRGEVQERIDGFITIDEAKRSHEQSVADLIARRKGVKTDFRDTFKEYDPSQYIDILEPHSGALF